MEAVVTLLKSGLLNIPDNGIVNVKQARALLWNAAWLQEYMNEKWHEDGSLVRELGTSPKLKNFALALIGPGGTGKTTVLKVEEALTLYRRS